MEFVPFDQRVPVRITGCIRTLVNYKTRHKMSGASDSYSDADMLRNAEFRSIAEASPRCG